MIHRHPTPVPTSIGDAACSRKEAPRYRLTDDEFRLEIAAIDECHDRLRKLSFQSQQRVLNWLQNWSHTEGNADGGVY